MRNPVYENNITTQKYFCQTLENEIGKVYTQLVGKEVKYCSNRQRT